ncbi:MAG TPA: CocE/NonD family hydrolase, partial [Solirubrobacteraceae bacterium]|nr:CocE/NonD family hydrolase [Solirubrobacteraceae bacterium]
MRAALVAVLTLLLAPAAAAAAPLGLADCGPREGVHQCSGVVETWDGVPLDTTVTLPREGAAGLPLVVAIHGFGNSKHEYLDPASTAYTDNAYGWARDGYAVLTYTARGLWGSCGTPESRAARPAACARGWIHLADVRYEGRDTQELVGRLVDEGVADPRRIGVTGDSYGGGQSLMLAALRDRVTLPDGTLVPWRSPSGTPLAIAGAAVVIPWTDLIYAIAPNGSTLTYAIAPPDASFSPVGVEKASVAAAVFAAAQNAIGPGQPVGEPFVPGRPMGYVAPPGADPEADVTSWVARATAGPPYTDPLARSIVDTLTRFHSPFHIDAGTPPAPLFIASGFTDDLFPVDEATRFANRTRRDHPQVPLSLLLGDFGHQRASNKPADRQRLLDAVHGWLDRHVRGDGRDVASGVTALTQTCPRDAPSGGPFTAPHVEALARGEVRFSTDAAQTVLPAGGDPAVAAAVDPATGGGDACARTTARDVPGTAAYRLPASTGYTLLGAPTVVAELGLTGERDTAQLAARLWDVAPDGSQTLVARALYRPSGEGAEVFQLHPNGYRFAPGHVPRLELVGHDAPYSRPSNAPYRIEVRRLELRLPVRDEPDCAAVLARSAPVVPAGQQLAPGVEARASTACDAGRQRRDDGQAAPAGADSRRAARERR